MPVPVALIGAAKLEKVIAFQHGEVVPEKQVMPIPESCADVLSVHVVRRQAVVVTLAERLKSSTQTSKLWPAAGITPLPEVAKVAEVEVVGGIGSDVGGQTSHEVPGLLRTAGKGNRSAKGVAGEDATDVHLRSGGAGQLVVAIASIEVPL